MSNAIKWGVMLGIVGVVISLVLHLTGMSDPAATGAMKWIPYLLILAIVSTFIILGIKAFKASNDNYLTVGNGLTQGLMIALISGIIMAIFTYVFYTYVDPEFLERTMDAALEQQGEMSEEQEEMMSGMMGTMASPAFMAGYLMFGRLFMGLIVGLIGGAVMKNVRPYNPDTL